jgi:acylphosphatase
MVMYRDFVARGARRLSLVGYVENKSDGSVEVVAQGERKNLEGLLALLHRGSLLSRVDSVDAEWRNPTERFDRFVIRL